MNILNIVLVSATIPNVAQYGCQGLQLKNSVKCLRLHYTYPIPPWPPAPPLRIRCKWFSLPYCTYSQLHWRSIPNCKILSNRNVSYFKVFPNCKLFRI